MRRLTTIGGTVVAALALLLGGLVLSTVSAPEAAAHTAGAPYNHHARTAYSGGCPAGYTPNGYMSGNVYGCKPSGYNRVVGNNAAACADATTVGPFRASIVQGWCTFDGVGPCNNYFTVPVSGGCISPVLILDGYNAPGSTDPNNAPPLDLATQICIESDLVQKEGMGLSVGGRFWYNGVQYEITTGAPFCGFNCYDGFDINCDARLGDFCAVELDRWKVNDVATCLLASSTPAN